MFHKPFRPLFDVSNSRLNLHCIVIFTRNVKVHSRTRHEVPEEEWRYKSTLSLTSALDGVSGQHHVPAALPLGKIPLIYCTGDWLGPRAGMDGCGTVWNNSPPLGFDHRTVQPFTRQQVAPQTGAFHSTNFTKRKFKLLFHLAEWMLLYNIFLIFMTPYHIKDYDYIKVIPLQKTSDADGCGVSSSVMIFLYQFPAETQITGHIYNELNVIKRDTQIITCGRLSVIFTHQSTIGFN